MFEWKLTPKAVSFSLSFFLLLFSFIFFLLKTNKIIEVSFSALYVKTRSHEHECHPQYLFDLEYRSRSFKLKQNVELIGDYDHAKFDRFRSMNKKKEKKKEKKSWF